MNAIRSHQLCRRICFVLIFVLLTGFMPVGLVGAFAQPRQTVLVFPMANNAQNAPCDIAERATNALTLAITDTPCLDAVQFSPVSPTVRRAVSEGRIRQVDVEEGDGSAATAILIGAALKADFVVVGGVQSFARKDVPCSVEMILSGQMYEVAPNINPATGEVCASPKVYKAFGVSGAGTARARQTANDATLITDAIRDAACKAAAALSNRTDVPVVAAPAKSKSGAYKWVLLAVLVGALALGVNNGGGGGGAPGATALPPKNVTLKENTPAITVSWQEPTGTTLTVLRYQIDRAVDGGSFQRIDPGTLGPGTTSFNDYGTSSGTHTYQYRLRTVYTNTAVSAYAYSGALVFTP